MQIKLQCVMCLFILFYNVQGRHAPRFSELDEEDQVLFRAAYEPAYDATYETPAYDHDAHDDDLGKLDLFKDGLWAIKSEIKVLKAYNKAFAANLLATKLKLKGLKKSLFLPVLEHHHSEPEHKPTYHYQTPAPYPQPQYQAPPQHQYQAPPQQQYQAPQPQYQPAVQPHYQPHDPYYGV